MGEYTESARRQKEREAVLRAEREFAESPLPGAGLRKYGSEAMRQSALYGAEQRNVAREATRLGLTSAEWRDLRSKLGRTPTRRDVE